jgi:hypothetical protein
LFSNLRNKSRAAGVTMASGGSADVAAVAQHFFHFPGADNGFHLNGE